MIHIFKGQLRGAADFGKDAGVAIYCDNTFCQQALHYPGATRENIPAIMHEYKANKPKGWWMTGKGKKVKHYCGRHTEKLVR